jgi:hypothetical protein
MGIGIYYIGDWMSPESSGYFETVVRNKVLAAMIMRFY